MPFLQQKEFFISSPENRKTNAYLQKVLTIEKERLTKFADVGDESLFLFCDISYDKDLLKWKTNSDEQTKKALETSKKVLSEISENDWTLKNIEEKLLAVAGDKRGDLLWPLRVSLTGAQKSPSPFEIAWALGRDESILRLKKALEII